LRTWFRSRYFRLFEVLVAVWLLGGAYFHDLTKVPFHGDESQWISTSYFFEAFVAGYRGPEWMHYDSPSDPEQPDSGVPQSFDAPDWALRSLAQGYAPGIWAAHYWTLTQPPMTRYTIAVGRLLGGYAPKDLNGPWDFEMDNFGNQRAGRMPSPGLLRSARAMMAFLAIVSGLLLFLIARQCAGPFAGYTFLVLFASSDFLLLHLRRAMSESPLLFWTSLALVFGARALWGLRAPEKARGWRSPLIWLLLMGVAAGLAGAVKLNALALGATGVALCCAIAWKRRKAPGPWPLRWGLVFWAAPLLLLAMLFVFIAVNPFLYPAPLPRMIAMALFRGWEMRGQATNTQWLIPNFAARLEIVPYRIFEDYTLLRFSLLNFILMGVGVYALARSAWRWLAGQRGAATIRGASTGLVILLAAAAVAILPLFTPLDWDRYYLYPVVFISLFIAASVGQLARWFQNTLDSPV